MSAVASLLRPVLWTVQPPPPPPARPPAIPPPADYGAAPPPRKKSFPWLWVTLGCGCLLLILIIGGIVGGLAYFGTRVQEQVQEFERETPVPVPSESTETAPPAAAGPADAAAVPSEELAHKAALARFDEGWVAKTVSHSDDWTKVTVAVGPPASEWVGEMDLVWNGTKYEVTAERAE